MEAVDSKSVGDVDASQKTLVRVLIRTGLEPSVQPLAGHGSQCLRVRTECY